MDINEKVPQNIQALVGNIGEGMVLFKLYELTYNHEHLEVFKNYSESGYDVGIRDARTGIKVRVEVKTRQRRISTSKESDKNSCHFTLTENEKKCADIMVGYWLEFNDFFVVPVDKLDQMKNGKYNNGDQKFVYKHIVSRKKTQQPNGHKYSEKTMIYVNNWKIILDEITN